MHLENVTAAAAKAWVFEEPNELGGPGSSGELNNTRVCQVRAKVTFQYDAAGSVQLDTQNPFGVFANDVETELGLLPRDDLPRPDGRFEVILLGAAYSTAPTQVRKVSLRVGHEKRELAVIGDRGWIDRRPGAFSAPVAFTRMPLTYERAFGGRCDVLVDVESPIEVSYPINPSGKGFDAAMQAEALGALLACPEGFPKYNYRQLLPNIEHVGALINTPEDEPLPAGWATLPMSMPLGSMKRMKAIMSGEMYAELSDEEAGEKLSEFPTESLHRAHPDWVIEPPAFGQAGQAGQAGEPSHASKPSNTGDEVELWGLHPDAELIRFRLPEVRVLVDYQLGEHNGTRTLTPYQLVLLPEEKRFYVVFDYDFTFDLQPTDERSLRVRLELGAVATSERTTGDSASR
jgi:hypothetical protein